MKLRFVSRNGVHHIAAFVLLCLLLVPQQSLAFGSVGHKTVAYIAEDHLTATTKEHIKSILPPNEDLVSVSTWADDVKNSRPNTKPWHYIDIPIRTEVTITNLATYCTGNDLLSQIRGEIAALKDPAAKNRVEALKFLIHFMGDLAMPLHCSDDTDRGGNEKVVRFGRAKMKLHALWDNLIEKEATEDPRELATELEKRITPAQIVEWSKGAPDDWVMDTHAVAKQAVYNWMSTGPTPEGAEVTLPKKYYATMRPVVDEQLEKAGIRLAQLLNDIFDHAGRTSADGNVSLTDEKLGTGFGHQEEQR